MKIHCTCGASISDSSDLIHNKGYVVPDQDLEDLQSAVEQSKGVSLHSIREHSKTIYQCHECDRLVLEINGKYHFFSADSPGESKYALRSVFGEKWKRHLRGNWADGKGSLWWGGGVKDQHVDFDIQDWDELSKSYFEAFERLKNQEILRSSFLRKNGVVIHEWQSK